MDARSQPDGSGLDDCPWKLFGIRLNVLCEDLLKDINTPTEVQLTSGSGGKQRSADYEKRRYYRRIKSAKCQVNLAFLDGDDPIQSGTTSDERGGLICAGTPSTGSNISGLSSSRRDDDRSYSIGNNARSRWERDQNEKSRSIVQDGTMSPREDANSPSIKSHDARSHSTKRDDAKSNSIKHDNARSPSIKKDDARSLSIRNDDAGSPSIRNKDARSTSIRSDDARSLSIRNDEARSPLVRKSDSRSPSITSEDVRSLLIRSDDARSPSIKSDDARSRPIRSDDARSPSVRSDRCKITSDRE